MDPELVALARQLEIVAGIATVLAVVCLCGVFELARRWIRVNRIIKKNEAFIAELKKHLPDQ